MFEDAPVNTGAVVWPDEDLAYMTVRRMQIKLHRWAKDDVSRRFGDLFNLVYDPAFLVHAWQRVSTNAGAKTPGVDRVTVAWVESRVGQFSHFYRRTEEPSIASSSSAVSKGSPCR